MTATAPTRPVPAAPTEPYHLSPEQVSFYDDNGYLVLRGLIPADLLARLQGAADRWMADGRAAGPGAGPDCKWADRPGGKTFFRVDYVHAKGEPASLELLGCPQILGIAESLAGVNFVPTYESMVFKDVDDGAEIAWHQDACHPRAYRIFNVDVYLDASRRGGGALRVVPKSQVAPHDVCKVRDRYGWEPPGVVHAEMEPGDVLVHDVMVLHGSEPVRGNTLRRTLYYEFRAAEQILAEGPWDRDWVGRRLRLVPLGLAEYARHHPAGPRFVWNVQPEYRPRPVGDAATELRIVHVVATPGSYCSAGDVPAAHSAAGEEPAG